MHNIELKSCDPLKNMNTSAGKKKFYGKYLDYTYVNVTSCSAGTFSASIFFIFLILSRDARSATTLVFSLLFTDDDDDDDHSR